MIITRSPLRISLLGGGTDIPAFYNKHTGCVFSFAINKYVYVSVNKKFDGSYRVSYSKTENVKTIGEIQHTLVRETLRNFIPLGGLEITSVADIPGSGTGLGSSSAFTVGLIKALSREIPSKQLAERAFNVEYVQCGHPVGKQDQYASALGGMNFIEFSKSGVDSYEVNLTPEFKNHFMSHVLLLWTGITRNANDILKQQTLNFGRGGTIEVGKQMARNAMDFHHEFITSVDPIKSLGSYLSENWRLKKFLTQNISNPTIDNIYNKGMDVGAYGGKLLGAGGGGFFLFIAPPQLHKEIEKETGLRSVLVDIDTEGSKVVYEQ